MIDNETGIEFVFPGTQEDLREAQEMYHTQNAKREKFLNRSNCNALRGIYSVIRKKYGNAPVTVLTVMRIIRDNGYLASDFLKVTFRLTEKDIHRALDQGLVPPSIKASLALYFEIKD